MSRSRPAAADATRARILDLAEALVQTRGFNGFSYADIAAEMGISKASLHYHFATKAELGRELVIRYSANFAGALQRIDEGEADAPARLRAYVKLYADVLRRQRMCLCGMVAAEYNTLPMQMQQAIRAFFEFNEGWLAQLLEQGSADGSLRLQVVPKEAARMLVGALEGAMLVARAYADPARFATAAQWLISQLQGDPRRRRAAATARAGTHSPQRRLRAATRAKVLEPRRARGR
jgi:TetR/AcrR family transcriptional regulator, transcriptional repressor for nem operon